MSVLKSYFNSTIDQNTPVTEDVLLVRKTTKDGCSEMVPEKVDYCAIQRENGPVSNWSVTALMSAGINIKDLTPKTSIPSGLDGYDSVEELLNDLSSINTKENTK